MKDKNPLAVIKVEGGIKPTLASSRQQRRKELENYLNQIWEHDPQRFDPNRNCMERERIERTCKLITSHVSLPGKKAVDLGCGYGEISKLLHSKGSQVNALDIAPQALGHLKDEPGLILKRECLPSTTLDDDAYDLVVCTDVIAYIPREEYRLLFSELSRVVNKDGKVICSTAIDIYSEDALERFVEFAQTEFDFDDWYLSYHKLHLKLSAFFEAPRRFVRAAGDDFFRQESVNRRFGFSRTWFNWNSKAAPAYFWKLVSWLFYPMTALLENSRGFLLFLEHISKSIWQEEAVSHAIFIGRRRPLVPPPTPEQIPEERKGKKQVWE